MKGGLAMAVPAARRPSRRGTLSAGMKRTLSRTVSGAKSRSPALPSAAAQCAHACMCDAAPHSRAERSFSF